MMSLTFVLFTQVSGSEPLGPLVFLRKRAGNLSIKLKVGSLSFEGIIILLIDFLNCRKALFTRNE